MAKMKMVDTINLNGLEYELDMFENGKHYILRNEDRNVVIFADMDYDGDISDVFNGIAKEPYDNLVSFLNYNDDLIVYWSKIEGTTSDYTICLDCNYKDGWNITKLRKYIQGFSDSDCYHYKYRVIVDNKMERF